MVMPTYFYGDDGKVEELGGVDELWVWESMRRSQASGG